MPGNLTSANVRVTSSNGHFWRAKTGITRRPQAETSHADAQVETSHGDPPMEMEAPPTEQIRASDSITPRRWREEPSPEWFDHGDWRL